MTCLPIIAQQQVVIPEISISALIGMISPLVGAVGVVVMVLGAYKSALRLFMPSNADGSPRALAPFTRHLALGLEFLIAASAIRLVVGPDLQSVGMLFGLVFGRIVIGLCQRWETPMAEVETTQPQPALPAPNFEPQLSAQGGATIGLTRPATTQHAPTNGTADFAAPLAGAAAS